jgi:hypothetical protein
LQNWGDYADMSQAVIVYVAFGSHVLLICWFGTQLTQHVRKKNPVDFSVDSVKKCSLYGRNPTPV